MGTNVIEVEPPLLIAREYDAMHCDILVVLICNIEMLPKGKLQRHRSRETASFPLKHHTESDGVMSS